MQDGVHATAETVRDDMETGRRSVDCLSARDSLERPLDPGVSSLLASEDPSRDGNSGRFRGEKDQKGRIIDGMGAITPLSEGWAKADTCMQHNRRLSLLPMTPICIYIMLGGLWLLA